MNSNHVEKLRKDISEAQYYQRRLKEKGKKVLSYKMEKRILEMKGMFEKGQKYTTDWWPDESNDADPKNKYYAEGHSAVCGCTLQEKMSHADIVQQKIDREKAADTVRHNQMKQRAAVRDIKSKKVKNCHRSWFQRLQPCYKRG